MSDTGVEGLSANQQQALKLGELLLNTNPDIARDAKRLAKKANPALRIPEIELEDAIDKASEKNTAKVAELEQRLIERDVTDRRRIFREDCTKQGLDPDEVEKIVVAEKCSPATAIKLALLQQQTGEPTAAAHHVMPQGTPVDMRPEKDIRNLSGAALRKWSADQAHSMVSDLMSKRRTAAR